VLRQPSPGEPVAGVTVLDPAPPRGASRRRIHAERLADLAAAIDAADPEASVDALVRLHGALPLVRVRAIQGALRPPGQPEAAEPTDGASLVLAPDVTAALEEAVGRAVLEATDRLGAPIADVRTAILRVLRRLVAVDRDAQPAAVAAVERVTESLVGRKRLARNGDRLRDPAAPSIDPELDAAMTRLERVLSVAAPPDLSEAARAAGCPPEGVRALIASGRVTRLDKDLAWATPTYHRLARLALDMALEGPLSPAAFRDATGTSRRFVLAILEDLDRREILRRTPDGHVPGPRVPTPASTP